MILNPAVAAMKRYLDLIRPWMSGEWDSESFKSEEAKKVVMDDTYHVFAIPSRPMPGWGEQMLLGRKRSEALMVLLSWVGRFNSARSRLDFSVLTKPQMATMVHGVIGKTGSGTLKDAFAEAERSL